MRCSRGGSGSRNDARRWSCASRSVSTRLLEELARLFLRQHARLDEAIRVRLPHRLLALDLLRHQRLRVRGLVLLVVPEAPVPDEVYDEVVAELLPVGERKPDRRQRSLGIVGVHMDDWHVEAFREVARVAGRAPLGWVGREPDLVVGDDVERPAGGVAVDRVEVERLGDDALARERRVAVDEDRERDRRVVDAASARPIRLLRPRMALDDGVDRLQVARVRGEGHLDVAGAGLPRLGGGEVVLDIARSALRIGHEGVDGALALELAQDRGVRAADRVREHVEPPAMCDPDHDLVRAPGGSKLDREVQHRDERVEALDGELLLPDERAPQVRLEGLDLRESEEESPLLFGRERLAEATRLDRPPQPHALRVVRDVLDLVRDRPHVDLLQPGQGVEQRLAFAREPQEPRGNLLLDLGRQRWIQTLGLERGIARRLGAERIEASREVTVHADRLHERHCRRDGGEQVEVGAFGGCRRLRRRRFHRRSRRRNGRRRAVSAVGRADVDDPGEPGQRREDCIVGALEELAPRGIDGLGILEVLLEEGADVAGVQIGRHR